MLQTFWNYQYCLGISYFPLFTPNHNLAKPCGSLSNTGKCMTSYWKYYISIIPRFLDIFPNQRIVHSVTVSVSIAITYVAFYVTFVTYVIYIVTGNPVYIYYIIISYVVKYKYHSTFIRAISRVLWKLSLKISC